ncbi:MAG: 30S ribosomal protein S1 [bacterium]|nr:30S ribosomal protein S1 [bacterium]
MNNLKESYKDEFLGQELSEVQYQEREKIKEEIKEEHIPTGLLDEDEMSGQELTGVEEEVLLSQPKPEPEPEPKKEIAKPAAEAVPEEKHDWSVYEETIKSVQQGEILSGTVVRIDSDSVLVDIGQKSEGIISMEELSHKAFSSPQEVVKVGDKIDVFVLQADNREGNLMLSKKRADLEQTWLKIQHAYDAQEEVKATVVERVRGGLLVDLGFRGFVPASHIEKRPVRDLDRYIGEVFRLRVLEIDRSRRKVVLSQKKVLEEEEQKLKENIVNDLYEGQIRKGKVARITNFGAFIDLGGIDGLAHLSELSWSWIKHPSELLSVGEEVEVMVLRIDKKQERISLSIKQAKLDPWLEVEEKFKVGTIVEGEIIKVVKSYVFVHMAEGIEGLIPLRELSDKRVSSPSEIVSVGRKVKVKVLEIKPSERRMILSLKEAAQVEAEKEVSSYLKGQGERGVTLGEIFEKSMASRLSSAKKAQAKPEKEAIETIEAEIEAEVEEEVEAKEDVETKGTEAEGIEPTKEKVEEAEAAEAAVEEAEAAEEAKIEVDPTKEEKGGK